MKKQLLMALVSASVTTASVAQYSNATLDGPWLAYAPPLDPINNPTTYLVFDGVGGIVDVGIFCQGVGGTYVVTSNGAITGTLQCGTTIPLTGQFYSPDSASVDLDGIEAALVRMADPSALEGTLTGTLSTQNCGIQSNVVLELNSEGVIIGSTGLIPPVTGRVYSDRGAFVGHLRTGGTNGWQEISIYGFQTGVTLSGVLDLDQDGCGTTSVDLTFQSITGIPETAQRAMDLAIFPNPASTTFQLRLGEPIRSTTTVNIFDSVGKLANSVTLQRDDQFIDISSLGNGSYLVQVIADDRTGTQRLVVQR